MKIDTHTHITLTQEELKKIIADNLKTQGYIADIQNIDFVINGDMYEPQTLRYCSITARKEDEVR